jgi:hypothetical protein
MNLKVLVNVCFIQANWNVYDERSKRLKTDTGDDFMGKYTFKEIMSKAKYGQANVKKEYTMHLYIWWCYYFAKAILGLKQSKKVEVTKISIKNPKVKKTTKISRQIKKADYLDMCSRLVKYVEKNKQLPNSVVHKAGGKEYTVYPRLLTEIFSRILVYYSKNGTLPSYVNANYKVFTKPKEYHQEVYDYVAKRTGKKFTTLDDVLAYIQKNGRYIFEFDDVRSNREVTNCLCGNCTDWMQWLWNMAKAMGYDVRCLHVQCRVSGTGHVRGQFKHKKHTGGKWINRDPAAVADGGSITSLWCEDGKLLATNPSWFMENLNR